jgi:modulator of FtsH protease
MNPLTADWQTFLAAELNASAALTGLVVVAISVNLARITAHELLPGRALETLFALTGAVLLTSLLLIPRQPVRVQAAECLLVGAFSLAAPFRFQIRAFRSSFPNSQVHPLMRAALSSLVGAPFLAAGALLWSGAAAGLYLAAAGVVLSLLVGVIGAWVLLVEIIR